MMALLVVKNSSKKFQAGVVVQNNRIIRYAQERLMAIELGNGAFGDDEPLTIPASLYIGFNNHFLPRIPDVWLTRLMLGHCYTKMELPDKLFRR